MTTDPSGPSFGSSERPVALCWPAGALRSRARSDAATIVHTTGRWVVRTRSSAYLVDLEAGVAARFPATHAPVDVLIAELRRDGDDIPLLALAAAAGEPMCLVLAIRDDGVPTVRRTTTVVAIEPAPHIGADPLGLPAHG